MTVSALVSTDWLAAHLNDQDVRVVDGSWHQPQTGRKARAEFTDAHIPGAVFFDIDAIADHSTALPHMLPSEEAFAHAVGELGIGDDDLVVAYDTRGVVSATRVWWTFRAFGHDRVAALDGGLPKWKAERRPLESGVPMPAPRRFTPKRRPELVRDLEAVRASITAQREQLVDARSLGRFIGTEPEPRAGLRPGHIPGSLNVPYEKLYRSDGTMKPAADLQREFENAGVDLTRPLVTSCGSGVTACVVALGLHVLGRDDAAVYDGSWTEWGGRADTPVDVTPPRS